MARTRNFSSSLLVVLAALLAMGLSSCSKSDKPTTPSGGYAAFESAMMQRNADGVWLTLSEETHDLFADVLGTLQVTVDMVDKLQPSDRKEARTAIGASLLDTVHTPKDLFHYIFANENIPIEAGYRVGLEAKKIEMEDDNRATVYTRGGLEIELVREEDEFWRVRNPLLEQFADAFSAMEENRAQLESAINLFGAATNEDEEIARLLGADKKSAEKTNKKDNADKATP